MSVEPISQQAFDDNWPDIAAQVQAIMARPATRKRFRVAAMYASGTAVLIGEVLRTSVGSVVVHRRPRTADALAWFDSAAERGRDVPVGDTQSGEVWRVQPFTGSDAIFVVRQKISVTGTQILARAAEGIAFK